MKHRPIWVANLNVPSSSAPALYRNITALVAHLTKMITEALEGASRKIGCLLHLCFVSGDINIYGSKFDEGRVSENGRLGANQSTEDC
jgi:hypothetical protein